MEARAIYKKGTMTGAGVVIRRLKVVMGLANVLVKNREDVISSLGVRMLQKRRSSDRPKGTISAAKVVIRRLRVVIKCLEAVISEKVNWIRCVPEFNVFKKHIFSREGRNEELKRCNKGLERWNKPAESSNPSFK